ncbi:MAG: hypothetical protein IT319_22190 [Anaerolineae bacterium]|nr:hypothetical protein [Anaerolineae bacterium]
MTDTPAASAVELLIKHLPPSASTLHLLDLGGGMGDLLAQRRADLAVTAALPEDTDQFDAAVAYNADLDDERLVWVLRALRPGGRLIAADVRSEPSRALVRRLESLGYTRILVEEMPTDASGVGMLMRGEKPHVTDDTHARIQSVAQRDAAVEFKGRYVHLLVRQTPNKPVWALKPGETVEWRALALADDGNPLLLAFSSLPNAVAFMQIAVVAGKIRDVNKVARFSRAAAQDWRLLVNPPMAALDGREIALVPVDPALAEAPDE